MRGQLRAEPCPRGLCPAGWDGAAAPRRRQRGAAVWPAPGGRAGSAGVAVRRLVAFRRGSVPQAQGGSAESTARFYFNVREGKEISVPFGRALLWLWFAQRLSPSFLDNPDTQSVLRFYYKIIDKIMVVMTDLSIKKGRECKYLPILCKYLPSNQHF